MKEKIDSDHSQAILARLAQGEYVDIPTLINEFSLNEQEITETLNSLVEKGDIKKHPNEEKYAATDQRHGLWKIRSFVDPNQFTQSSSRLSPETWQKIRETIQEIENQTSQK